MESASYYVLPMVMLSITSLVVLVFFTGRSIDGRSRAAMPTAIGILISLITYMLVRSSVGDGTGMSGMLTVDALGYGAGLICMLASLVTVPLLHSAMVKADRQQAEILALVPLALVGMLVMVLSNHMVSLFLGLETMSLALYILSGSFRGDSRSIEAGMKYLLTGAFASGILLFGIALIYGATGSFDLGEIGAWVAATMGAESGHEASGGLGTFAAVGFLMVLVGMAFKLALVPFHQWAPDVYDGAPTAVTGLMATTVKVVTFTALLRLVLAQSSAGNEWLVSMLVFLAALTVVMGNLGALAQTSAKRMLAWSGISHAGYILMPVVVLVSAAGHSDVEAATVLRSDAMESVVFYLVAYVVMNLGAFAVLQATETRDRTGHTYGELAGLYQRHPLLAGSMLVFMLALAGIPLTVGFVAKMNVFRNLLAMEEGTGRLILLILLGLGSVVGFAFYLRVVVAIFMEKPEAPSSSVPAPSPLILGLILLLAVVTIWWGCGPNFCGIGVDGLVDWARSAAR